MKLNISSEDISANDMKMQNKFKELDMCEVILPQVQSL